MTPHKLKTGKSFRRLYHEGTALYYENGEVFIS